MLAVLPLLTVAACVLSTDFGSFSGGSKDGGPTSESGFGSTEAGMRDAGGNVADADAGTDAGPQTYQDLIRADKPIAYFTFDDAPGATMVLESITGDHGVIEGTGYAFGVAGIAGTAVRSDGSSNMNFGQILSFTGDQAWTFEVWIHPQVHDGKTFYEYFNKRDGTSNGLAIYLRNENGVTAQLEQDWDTGARGVSVALPALDHFIHIVFTYLPGTGVRGWADGFKGNLGYDNDGGPTSTATDCTIVDSVEGTIDEMAIYDYALSDDQIATHYAKGRLR